HRHDDVDVRQHLDALVQSQRHRDRGQSADDADDDQLPQGVLRNADDLGQTAVDLQGAQTDGDGDAEDGADDGDTSMNLPMGPWIFSPRMGWKIELTRGGRLR